MEKIAKLELASTVFYLSLAGKLQMEPYHKDGIITANIAFESGLLRQDENGAWVPDLSQAQKFLEHLNDFFWEHQAPVWESSDPDEANIVSRDILEQFLEKSDCVNWLMQRTASSSD